MTRQIDPVEFKTYRVYRGDETIVVSIGPKHPLTNLYPIIVVHPNYQWVGQRNAHDIYLYHNIKVISR